jgi:hypothetical protein
MAMTCFSKANDLQSLLILYQASGNAEGLIELGSKAGNSFLGFM